MMKPQAHSLTRIFLIGASLLMLAANAVRGQAPTKIFVASYGNDANDGSRASPKRNFQAAHNAVAAGGQIVVLDTAGYGTLGITKSLSVTVPPGVNGFITVAGNGTGVFINAAASDVVSLRGLIVEGGNGGNGVSVQSAGDVTMEDCTVRNFNFGLTSTGNGIRFYLHNTVLRECYDGLHLQPFVSSSTLRATLSACSLEENDDHGVYAGGPDGSVVDVTLTDCVIANNVAGILAKFPGGIVRASNCTITGNYGGVLTDGGQVLSRGDNTLEANINGGNTFPGAYSAK